MRKLSEIKDLREVIKNLVPLLAAKGLMVTQQGTQAYVLYDKNGQPTRVNIPFLPDEASDDLVTAIHGFIDHEVAHVLFTNAAVGKVERSKDPTLHTFHNIIEDPLIEKLMGEKFPGSKSNLTKTQGFFLEKIVEPSIVEAAGDIEKEFTALGVPMIRAMSGQKVMQDFMDANGYWEHPHVKAMLGKLPADFSERLQKMRNTEESFVLAQELHRVWGKPTPPPPPPSSGGGDDEEESEPGDEKSENEDGEGSNTEKPEDEDDKGSDGESSPQPTSEGEEDPEAESDPADDQSTESDSKSQEPKEPEKEEKPEGDNDGDEPENDDAEDEADTGAGDSDEADEPAEKPAETPAEEPAEEDEEPTEEADDVAAPAADAEEDEEDDAGEGGGAPASQETEDDEAEDGEKEAAEEDGGGQAGAADNDEEGGENDQERINEGDRGAGSDEGGLKPPPPPPGEDPFAQSIGGVIADEAIRQTKQAEYRVFSRDYDEIEPYRRDMDPKEFEEFDEKTRGMIAPMQKDLERLIAARSSRLNIPGFRSGRLHSSGLHKLTVGDDRVFRRRFETSTKATAVTLLIDNSGSMGGTKCYTAMQAGYALGQTLERINVPCEILGFCTGDFPSSVHAEILQSEAAIGREYTHYSTLIMKVFKSFSERVTPVVKQSIGFMAKRQEGLSANADGDAVEAAGERLLKRKEERKILIVLSDGNPAAATSGRQGTAELNAHLHMAIAKLGKQGVETLGIGIMSEAVKSFYPKHVILKDIKDLPSLVVGEMKKMLLK